MCGILSPWSTCKTKSISNTPAVYKELGIPLIYPWGASTAKSKEDNKEKESLYLDRFV